MESPAPSVPIKIREHVRLVLIPAEPVPEFFHAGRAVLADHAYEDRAPRAFRLLATNASLPCFREDGRQLVTQLQRFQQFPLAAVEPGLVAGRAHVDAVRDRAGELVLR